MRSAAWLPFPPRRTARPGRAIRGNGRLLRGVLAGAAGTAAMTTTGFAHREGHARRRGMSPADITEILDYDDSDHVVVAASTVLQRVIGWAPRTPGGRHALFRLVHWGYGSGGGGAHAGPWPCSPSWRGPRCRGGGGPACSRSASCSTPSTPPPSPAPMPRSTVVRAEAAARPQRRDGHEDPARPRSPPLR